MTNQAQHTPGPLVLDGSSETFVMTEGGQFVANCYDTFERIAEHKANARLIAAAYTSYDKHCGPRAVECAEGDLLGELLEALRLAVSWLERVPVGTACNACPDGANLESFRAAIAKATGQ